MKYKIILILILLLALFLRTINLNQVPIELFGDEIDVGDQAYSILKTGQDYYGQPFPIMFHSMAEYRLPLFIYSSVPFIAIFGLNEWGLRLTSVFWGILGIWGIYLLASQMFNKRIGLIAAFVLAITPWHFHYSRQAGIEAEVLLTIATLAVWAFLKGLNNFKYLLLSAFLFALSFYSYAIAALFIPLLGISLIALYHKKIFALGIKKIMMVVLVGLVVLIPYGIITFSGSTLQRSSIISVFTNKDLATEVTSHRNEQDNSLASKIFYNRPSVLADTILVNYVRAFSPEFLFLRGDPNLRQSIGTMGMLYFFEAILIIVGIFWIVKKKWDYRLILIWLLLAVIPSSTTIDGGNHGSRLLLMVLPLTLMAALGIDVLAANIKKKKIMVLSLVILVLAIFNISTYMYRYFEIWPKDSWRFWHDGYKEAMLYIKDNDASYTRVYINNTYEPALQRFMFWFAYDPTLFHKQFKGDQSIPNFVDKFDGFSLGDKYYFGTAAGENKYESLPALVKQGEMYMVSNRDEAGSADWRISPPNGIKVLKTVVDPFDKPIFYVITKI